MTEMKCLSISPGRNIFTGAPFLTLHLFQPGSTFSQALFLKNLSNQKRQLVSLKANFVELKLSLKKINKFAGTFPQYPD